MYGREYIELRSSVYVQFKYSEVRSNGYVQKSIQIYGVLFM